MRHKLRFRVWHNLFLWLVLPVLFNPVLAGNNLIHHQLQVTLQPTHSRLTITDIIQFPAGTTEVSFALNSSLSVTSGAANLEKLTKTAENQLHYYQLSRLPPNGKVQLEIQGRLESQQDKDLFGMPHRVFNEKQLYLDGSSSWLPRFETLPRFTFDLQVSAPADWQIISQGRRSLINGMHTYHMPHPQDDIYLLGGPYQRYSQMMDDTEIEVYLYEPNPALADKYLQATARYLPHYSELIGQYPYAKFAIVENRWQTGYGMPSFTLLGSSVIRLPFILYTSLPHEILHNWWGNGVFIDFSNGNWSEGLTAYLADHANSEQKNQDSEYRRKALERYSNFAARQRDFALSEFRARHSEASQAIGYSKSLMLFHMLRKAIGDEAFISGIRRFWQQYRFKPASFTDLINTLTQGSPIDAASFAEQWLTRVGAPEISLSDAHLTALQPGYRLDVTILQQQDGPAYSLLLPLTIRFNDSEPSQTRQLQLNSKQQHFSFNLEQRPEAITLDPEFDVFRLLHPDERPSSIGRMFGAPEQILVYPGKASKAEQKAWLELAAAWDNTYDNVKILKDSEFGSAPEQSAVWLLGWENLKLKELGSRFTSENQQLLKDTAVIGQQPYSSSENALVLLDPDASRAPLGFIGAGETTAIQALARKLPHYNSYGMLIFTLPGVSNIVKSPLPVSTSSMTRQLQ